MGLAVEKLLNLGLTKATTESKIRLIRQVNGLNLFFFIVAFSVGLIAFSMESRGSLALLIIQILATPLYFSNIFFTYKGKIETTRVMTIHVFEWQMFMIILVTNFWQSPVLFVVLLYPLLAALVEVAIMKHFLIGLLQIALIYGIHFFSPVIENQILSFSNLTPFVSEIFRIMAIVYFPFMGAVIMRIIFRENLRAREKQKEMLLQITFSKKQIENYVEALKDEAQKLKAEIEVAKKIQTMVLPTENEIKQIEELEISAMMSPAEQVGGDYFDIIKVKDIITIAIGDVTGHGLTSGVIMLMAQTSIRTIAEIGITDSREFLAILNKVLYANIQRINEDRNMTLSILSYKKNKFTLSGQHESVIICRKSGRIETFETLPLGFYVGFLPDITPYIQSRVIELEKDDIMFLYSDGITEAENNEGKQFGLSNIHEILVQNRHLSTKKIKFKLLKTFYNFIGNAKINDDISMVIIKQK